MQLDWLKYRQVSTLFDSDYFLAITESLDLESALLLKDLAQKTKQLEAQQLIHQDTFYQSEAAFRQNNVIMAKLVPTNYFHDFKEEVKQFGLENEGALMIAFEKEMAYFKLNHMIPHVKQHPILCHYYGKIL